MICTCLCYSAQFQLKRHAHPYAIIWLCPMSYLARLLSKKHRKFGCLYEMGTWQWVSHNLTCGFAQTSFIRLMQLPYCCHNRGATCATCALQICSRAGLALSMMSTVYYMPVHAFYILVQSTGLLPWGLKQSNCFGIRFDSQQVAYSFKSLV